MRKTTIQDDIKFAAQMANTITVREACQMFGKRETTVYVAINCGSVYAELRGIPDGNPRARGLWLINLQSAIEYWGNPKGTV